MKLRALGILLLSILVTAACTDRDSDRNLVQKSDGSTVETTIARDGTKTEVRTFPSGEVSRVTRITRPGDKPDVVVEFRDGRKAELDEDSDIEEAMEATADAIAAAAKETWEVSKDIGEEIGDKAEDVADKTADAAKKVGKEAKKAGKKIKDKID